VEVGNQVVRLSGFHDYIACVRLNGSLDVIPKMCCIHRWYVAPAFQRPNDIVT
jgi:hypothetical protein